MSLAIMWVFIFLAVCCFMGSMKGVRLDSGSSGNQPTARGRWRKRSAKRTKPSMVSPRTSTHRQEPVPPQEPSGAPEEYRYIEDGVVRVAKKGTDEYALIAAVVGNLRRGRSTWK